MKKLISTALFVGMILSVGAQNKTKMTEEEKKEAMEQLEMLYKFETGIAFSGLDSLAKNKEFKQDILPWDKWADEFKHESFKDDLSRLFTCLEKASIEPEKDSPIFCDLMLRGKEDVSSYFGGRKGAGLWEKYYHKDGNGNFTGFCKDLFFDLETDLQLHLTDKQGKPVYIHPEGDIYLLEGGNYAKNKDMLNIWFGIQMPLTVPYQEIAGGHISLSFYMPQEYDRITVPIKGFGDKPVQVTWGSKTFSIEKVDGNGFIISANAATLDKLKGIEFLYYRDGNWYEPSSSTATTGDLDKLLKHGTGKITFEEWMKEKGIDPNNLEETLEHFMGDVFSEEDAGMDDARLMGKHYKIALQGDSLLLYMPVEERRKVADITVFVPSEGKESRSEINCELCNELMEWLRTEKSPDNKNRAEPEEVDYFSPDFQPAKPINPQTGTPDEWHIVLAQLLRKPEEAVEQGITGRMTAEVTIEADGIVSNVKINGDPHPLLAKAVCDCIYSMKFVPAKWKEKAISFVATVPVIFN